MTYTVAHPQARLSISAERESQHKQHLALAEQRAADFARINATIVGRLEELAEMGHSASPGFIREVAQDACRVIRAAQVRA